MTVSSWQEWVSAVQTWDGAEPLEFTRGEWNDHAPEASELYELLTAGIDACRQRIWVAFGGPMGLFDMPDPEVLAVEAWRRLYEYERKQLAQWVWDTYGYHTPLAEDKFLQLMTRVGAGVSALALWQETAHPVVVEAIRAASYYERARKAVLRRKARGESPKSVLGKYYAQYRNFLGRFRALAEAAVRMAARAESGQG